METFAIERVREYGAQLAIVLGSGLHSLVQDPARDCVIPYQEISDLPRSSVKGHAGRFVLGEIGKARVVFAQGRAHLYEGYDAREITAGVRFLAQAGLTHLILTNAAGSLNPDFPPGSWMMIRDHLNLTSASPLSGDSGFVDLSNAYSADWREHFAGAAQEMNLTLHEGVYAGVRGPHYETPAEVKMLRILGADAVGMSTICETIQARALDLEVAGFSCLSNWAAGQSQSFVSHTEILTAGDAAAGTLRQLLEAVL